MERQITLDEDAQKLFQQLGGLDTGVRGRAADYSENSGLTGALAEEEKRSDQWRLALMEFVSRSAGYLNLVRLSGSVEAARIAN